MRIPYSMQRTVTMFVTVFVVTVIVFSTANAHCDTMNGPVIKDAQSALKNNDIGPVLKWIKKEHEVEISALFKKTTILRKISPEVKEIADRLFFETLVRLHRAGEGAPYTGLKADSHDNAIEEADRAIEQGTAENLIFGLTTSIEHELHKKFDRVMKTKTTMNKSVEEGREYVDAYVQYVHYVEQLGTMAVGQQTEKQQESSSHQH